jgi:hypothetical protein
LEARDLSQVYYVEIPVGHVQTAVVAAAERMLRLVVDDLHLGHIRIRWFTTRPFEERPADWTELGAGLLNVRAWAELDGMDDAVSGTIWIHRTSRALDAAAVVAREARHIWQYANRGSLDASDAEAYQNQPELLKKWRDHSQDDAP